MTEQKIELKMIRMSEVQSQEIEWLWYPFIPYGKLTIIQGDPGDGKTTMVLNLAAKLSKGEALDENMKVTEPVNVIYIICIYTKHAFTINIGFYDNIHFINRSISYASRGSSYSACTS
jgi:RecA-family ATPase